MKNASGRYILDEKGEAVPCPDLMTRAEWFEKYRKQRIVKQEMVGRFWVSTVFLSLDHSFNGPQPVLWETMVFRGKGGATQDMDRCPGNREQAEAMHQRMVEKVRTQRRGAKAKRKEA